LSSPGALFVYPTFLFSKEVFAMLLFLLAVFFLVCGLVCLCAAPVILRRGMLGFKRAWIREVLFLFYVASACWALYQCLHLVHIVSF
jgi:hypothetical protein